MEIRRIVDSMSPMDIFNLYKQEIPFCNHKIEELGKKFRKLLYTNRCDVHFFNPVEFRRKSGLNIVYQYFDKGNHYPGDKRLGVFFYIWFNYRNSIYGLRPILDRQYGIIPFFFTSHFIQRYIERELKDNTISKVEALNIFIRNNTKNAMKCKPSEKYSQNGWLCKNQGLCFVEVKPDSTVIMKTFLPWDYLNSEQKSGSKDIFAETMKRGFDFTIPDSLIDENDILS